MTASFNAEEILYATGGFVRSGAICDQKASLSWELGTMSEGDWFLAIPSELNDERGCAKSALNKGAGGLIVSRGTRCSSITREIPIITVSDAQVALLDLVRHWRYRVRPIVVGVSGSTGRRSTMILLSQLLKEQFKTHLAFMSTLGAFGCVKEVLSMPLNTEVLIFEAGAAKRGDIKSLAGALEPDLGVITPISHPLPSPERDYLSASLYCELLETLADFPRDRVGAVIFDENPAVQKRVDEVLTDLIGQKYSLSGKSISHRLSQNSLNELRHEMERTLHLTVSRAELWCAVEAAKVLGISKQTLEDLLQLDAIPENSNLHPIKRIV